MKVEQKKHFFKNPFSTENGFLLKKGEIAYEEYGKPDAPVIYVCHAAFRNSHAAGYYSKSDSAPGFWDDLIGPDKVFNTNRFRIICANSLGSIFGTTSPLTINPDTKKTYGADFPKITIKDMVRFHKQFLDELHIDKLFMITGASMGGMQSLLAAMMFPDLIESVFITASGGYVPPGIKAMHYYMLELIKSDPNFNLGHYKPGSKLESIRNFGMFCRLIYVHANFFDKLIQSDPDAKNSKPDHLIFLNEYFHKDLDLFQKTMDPNCLIRIIEAMDSFDLSSYAENYQKALEKITCPLLLVNFDTDSQFPHQYSEEIGDLMNEKNPGQVRVRNKNTAWGHLACLFETKLFESDLKEFISDLS